MTNDPAPDDPHPRASDDAATHRVDPVNRWATEHYGFDDEPVDAGAPSAVRAPAAGSVSGVRRRTGALLAAGVFGTAVIGGAGGAALAAEGPDGGGNGPGGHGGGSR